MKNQRFIIFIPLPVLSVSCSQNKYVEIAKEKNIRVNTDLHLAAEKGDKEIVEILVGQDANVDAINKYSNTSLHMAVWGGHLAVVEILVRAGANVNVPNTRCYMPLHLAAKSGHTAIVEMLVRAVRI